MEYPELADRTDRFTRGEPRAVTVSGDGTRVAFLRSGGPQDPASALWVLDVATGTERLIAAPDGLGSPADGDTGHGNGDTGGSHGTDGEGIEAYAVDGMARIAAFAFARRLFRADLVTGEVVEVATAAAVTDPRPDPTGERIAYVTVDPRAGTAALRVVEPDGTDLLLAGEPHSPVSWGTLTTGGLRSTPTQGYWWAPNGRSVLAARTDPGLALRADGARSPRVSLHVLDLDGGWVDVHWDRETYPYLVDVRWADGGPLITVLRRSQQHGLVLSVEPRTGETQVHAELADARRVDPVPGTPRHLPDGRVLVGGELAHDGYDARCLFADGSLLTPPSLYVRRVVGVLPRHDQPMAGSDLVLEATAGEPGEQHLYRTSTGVTGGADARRLTTSPGWHSAVVGGGLLVVGSRSLEHDGLRWTVWRGDKQVATLTGAPAAPPVIPRPILERVGDRRLPAAVLYPARHVAGRRLPVLIDLGDGPGAPQVVNDRARWLERQWWADAGFAVVGVDGRGTPGTAPSYEKVVYRRLGDVALADLVDALLALVGKHPDLDLTRVAVRGTDLGGWLAALAVLRRPDVFACAVARSPVTDWTMLPIEVAERWLGPVEDGPAGGEVYARHNLVELAAEQPVYPDDARPLLLVHGMRDAAVVPDHTLRLSAALLATGRPHAVLPVSDAADLRTGYAARLLPQELDFLRRHLP